MYYDDNTNRCAAAAGNAPCWLRKNGPCFGKCSMTICLEDAEALIKKYAEWEIDDITIYGKRITFAEWASNFERFDIRSSLFLLSQ